MPRTLLAVARNGSPEALARAAIAELGGNRGNIHHDLDQMIADMKYVKPGVVGGSSVHPC